MGKEHAKIKVLELECMASEEEEEKEYRVERSCVMKVRWRRA